MFLTSAKFDLSMLQSEFKVKLKSSKPEIEYGPLPIIQNMERVVVFCVEHLLSEIGYLSGIADPDSIPSLNPEYEAFDLVAVSKTLLNFHKMAHSIIESDRNKQ